MKKFEVRICVFVTVESVDESSAQTITEDAMRAALENFSENDEAIVSYATDDISVLPLDDEAAA